MNYIYYTLLPRSTASAITASASRIDHSAGWNISLVYPHKHTHPEGPGKKKRCYTYSFSLYTKIYHSGTILKLPPLVNCCVRFVCVCVFVWLLFGSSAPITHSEHSSAPHREYEVRSATNARARAATLRHLTLPPHRSKHSTHAWPRTERTNARAHCVHGAPCCDLGEVQQHQQSSTLNQPAPTLHL